jgi:hypothetical protein
MGSHTTCVVTPQQNLGLIGAAHMQRGYKIAVYTENIPTIRVCRGAIVTGLLSHNVTEITQLPPSLGGDKPLVCAAQF